MSNDRMERLAEVARLIQEQWKLLEPGRLEELSPGELELCVVRNKRIGALLAMLGARSAPRQEEIRLIARRVAEPEQDLEN